MAKKNDKSTVPSQETTPTPAAPVQDSPASPAPPVQETPPPTANESVSRETPPADGDDKTGGDEAPKAAHGRGRPATAKDADGNPIVDPETGKPMTVRHPRAKELGAVNVPDGDASPPVTAAAPDKRRGPRADRERLASATRPAPEPPKPAIDPAIARALATEAGRLKIALAAPQLKLLIGTMFSKLAQTGVSAIGGPELNAVPVQYLKTVPVYREDKTVEKGIVVSDTGMADEAVAQALSEVLAYFLPAIPDAAWAPAAATGLAIGLAVGAAWGRAPSES